MAKTDVDRARPGVLEALAGAERHALPYLEAVDAEARDALRLAEEVARGETYPTPTEALRQAHDALGVAVKRESLRAEAGSVAWALWTAVGAAVALALGNAKDASTRGAPVRKWARAADEKAARDEAERTLLAYQEAFRALRSGERPLRLSAGCRGDGGEENVVEVLGLDRICGGVVIDHDVPVLATDWCVRALRVPDEYVRDLARQVQRATAEAAKRKARSVCRECHDEYDRPSSGRDDGFCSASCASAYDAGLEGGSK